MRDLVMRGWWRNSLSMLDVTRVDGHLRKSAQAERDERLCAGDRVGHRDGQRRRGRGPGKAKSRTLKQKPFRCMPKPLRKLESISRPFTLLLFEAAFVRRGNAKCIVT